jgi:GNAT superfamily N-acetyltransferase
MMTIQIRQGKPSDIKDVLALIRELAEYEKAPEEVTVTEEELLDDGFGSRKLYDFIVAEADDQIVGMAFYYPRYSTWKGRTIHLEDFIVKSSHRRHGVGQLLWDELLRIAADFGARRLEWVVLNWNEPALAFYQKQNALIDDEWSIGQLTGEQIQRKINE